ncbi:MAG: biopolymer transporter ExbD [Myxococcota bacterium]
MGAALGGRGSGPISDINVTPLIDVVLVLLVVFMVITPLLSSGLAVELPKATQTVTMNDAGQHIVVSMTKDGQWAVDQNRLDNADPDELMAAIDDARKENIDRWQNPDLCPARGALRHHPREGRRRGSNTARSARCWTCSRSTTRPRCSSPRARRSRPWGPSSGRRVPSATST